MNQYSLDPDKVPIWLSNYFNDLKGECNVIAGINDDDCAILEFPDNQLVITTDFLNSSPIALELNIGTLWDIGRLVVASNLSDLCGTGAKPLAMLLAVTMKRNSKFEDFKELVKGVKFELEQYGIPLIGGDTKLGKANSFLGVAIGASNSKRKLFKKNGAEPNDLLWVSGFLGSNCAAVYGLSKQKMPEQWNNWAKKTILEPNIPLKKSLEVSYLRLGNGGTDISDGLGSDLLGLCNASNVGVVVEVDSIPIMPQVIEVARLKKVEPWIFSFIIGGDFQFIVSSNECNSHEMNKIGFTKIGHLTNEKDKLVKLSNGEYIKMPLFGHRDARNKSFSDEIEYIMKEIIKGH